jgi:tetratricopeptide (TPR) repeat protein
MIASNRAKREPFGYAGPVSTTEATPTAADDATLAGDTLGDEARSEAASVARLEPGSLIDRYVLLGKLGQGGMGVVWAAFDPELERKVAVKLLPPDRAGSHATQRLLREAKALARLSHPQVVAIHDAGVHQGRVWIAMEYVEGHTLDAWLELETRSWRAILAVVLLAGRGLAAAHEKGLVHRDFKPSNVMIDADGRVRVMDFGLARAADREEDEEHGRMQGTPAYMAPEQFRAGSTDARTDQFAFCVASWEALHGERPFRGPTLFQLSEAVTQGRIEPPPSKSAVPQWLRRALERGLAVDPEQRWPSMDALLDRLERDPSRTRWLGVGATGLALALVAGVSWQRITDAHEREAAEQACVAAGQAIFVEDWTADRQTAIETAFAQVELGYAADSFARTQTELDRYAQHWADMQTRACREGASEHSAQRQACFHERRMLFRSLVELLAEANAPMVTRAIESVSQLPALELCADDRWLASQPPPPDLLAADPELERLRGRQAKALAHSWTGAYEQAAAEFHAIIAELEAHEPSVTAPTIYAQLFLAETLVKLGRHDEARSALEQAFATALEHGRDELALEAAALLAGLTGSRMAKVEVGLAWIAVAEALLQRSGREGTLDEAEVRNERGTVLMRAAEFERARVDFERALALREAALGRDHLSMVAVLNNLAGVHMQQGQPGKARPFAERTLTIQEAAFGPEHVQLAMTLNNLAALYTAEGQLDQAFAALERALSLSERGLGPEHPDTLGATINLGLLEVQRGQLDHAEALSERALALVDGPLRGSPRAARAHGLRGTVHEARGHHELALTEHGEALRSDRELLSDGHPQLGYWLTLVGEDLVALERFADAREPLEQAIALHEQAKAPAHVIAHARLALAEVKWVAGDHARALELGELALAGFASSESTREQRQRAQTWMDEHTTK